MLKDVLTVLASITAVLGSILGILKYSQYRTRRDKIMLVRQAFDGVVKSLASNVEVERLAGAILLRRFFDRETEVGIAGTPYWKEAVDVTAAILRGQATGNFQKLLADGLGFAPTLERADLQKTNLQFAYLGSRKNEHNEEIPTNLGYADFYRADQVRDVCLATPWNQIEAGMAVMFGLPIFMVCERGVAGGVFEIPPSEHQIYRVFADDDWSASGIASSFDSWCADVRERSRLAQPG